MSEKDTNIHKDHRRRLRNRYEREGLQAFEDHNVLELLLFYALPRKDTNPLAHRLLERFGSLRAVFEATQSELCSVEGIGPSTAAFLKLCPEIARRSDAEALEGAPFVTDSRLGSYFVNYFRYMPPESACIMLLDRGMKFLSLEPLVYTDISFPECVLTRSLDVVGDKVFCAVLAHNHGDAGTVPTKQDISVTEEVRRALLFRGVQLVAHYIISGFDYENIMERESAHAVYKEEI